MMINDGMMLIKVLVMWWFVSWLLWVILVGVVGIIVYYFLK